MNEMKIKFNEVNCTNSDPGLAYVDGYPTIAIYDKIIIVLWFIII